MRSVEKGCLLHQALAQSTVYCRMKGWRKRMSSTLIKLGPCPLGGRVPSKEGTHSAHPSEETFTV